MKRIVKYSVGLLLFVVVALSLVPFFLDVEDDRTQIEQRVEDATGRHLQIGKLSLSLFPWVGVTLDDVIMANRSHFSSQDFMQVKHLDVQVALLPLLHQNLEIKRFVLNEPKIFLEKNAQGEGNWQDLLPAASANAPVEPNNKGKVTHTTPSVPATQQEKKAPLLAALSADSMVLKDGELIWRDAQTGRDVSLTAVQVKLDDVQLERPIQVHVSAKLNQDQVTFDFQVGPVGDLAMLNINHLPIQLHAQSLGMRLAPWKQSLPELPEWLGRIDQSKIRFDLQVEQRPDGVRLFAGQMALLAAMKVRSDWKVEMPSLSTVDIHDLSVAVNDRKMLALQGHVDHLNKTPQYQLRMQSEVLERAWLASLFPALESMYAGNAKPWKQVKIGLSLAGTPTRVDVRDMQLLLNDEVVQLSGNLDLAKAPDIRLRLAAKSLHLDPWLPQAKESSSAPVADGYAQTSESSGVTVQAKEPDLRFLKKWRVSLQMQVERLFAKGLDIGHFRTVVNGGKGLFKMDPLQFELAGGSVREIASLNVAAYPAQWRESVNVTGVHLLPILQVLAESDMLDGTLKLNTNLHATGLLPESIRHGLQGTAQLSLLNGRMKGFDIAGGLRNLSSIGQAKETQYTDFAQLQGSFKVHDGIAKNNDLFMASPLFRLSGKGVVSLPEMSMDYHVRPKLIGSLVGQGDVVKNRSGITVPLHIFGPFTALSVKPEITTDTILQEASKLKGKAPKVVDLLNKNKSLLHKKLNNEQKKKVNQAVKGLLGL